MTNKLSKEIRILSKYISRFLNERCVDDTSIDLTGPQGLIIAYLCDNNDKDVFQRDIEREFNIRRSTATGMLQNLENKGYINREEVDFDARLKKLVLSDKAKSLHQAISNSIEEVESQMLKDISEEEVAVFYTVINKMKENLCKE